MCASARSRIRGYFRSDRAHWPRHGDCVRCFTIAALVLKSSSALPSRAGRSMPATIGDTDATTLGRVLAPLAAMHAPHSGVYALVDGRDAFAARMQFTQAAERSLDVQYYIWHKDMSGTLLLDALRAAAER